MAFFKFFLMLSNTLKESLEKVYYYFVLGYQIHVIFSEISNYSPLCMFWLNDSFKTCDTNSKLCLIWNDAETSKTVIKRNVLEVSQWKWKFLEAIYGWMIFVLNICSSFYRCIEQNHVITTTGMINIWTRVAFIKHFHSVFLNNKDKSFYGMNFLLTFSQSNRSVGLSGQYRCEMNKDVY